MFMLQCCTSFILISIIKNLKRKRFQLILIQQFKILNNTRESKLDLLFHLTLSFNNNILFPEKFISFQFVNLTFKLGINNTFWIIQIILHYFKMIKELSTVRECIVNTNVTLKSIIQVSITITQKQF